MVIDLSVPPLRSSCVVAVLSAAHESHWRARTCNYSPLHAILSIRSVTSLAEKALGSLVEAFLSSAS